MCNVLINNSLLDDFTKKINRKTLFNVLLLIQYYLFEI